MGAPIACHNGLFAIAPVAQQEKLENQYMLENITVASLNIKFHSIDFQIL